MIKIENVQIFGWEAAVRGMRNPMNSWDKSDSKLADVGHEITHYEIGDNDLKLMKQLVAAGSDHSKFMRMINVTFDVTAPLYWWKEMDTYKIGTVRNSCSTMHKIHAKELTLEDFSCEHLHIRQSVDVIKETVEALNVFRDVYLNGGILYENNGAPKMFEPKDKYIWWQMIQLLPSSYNQRATVQLNYSVLRNMYHSRKNHKLDEWRDFCKWIETLPCSELITLISEFRDLPFDKYEFVTDKDGQWIWDERRINAYFDLNCRSNISTIMSELITSMNEEDMGEWIESCENIKCSKCGSEFSGEITYMCISENWKYPKFCPNCGKKMKISNEESDVDS